MRIASKLYTVARTVNTIEALTSGNPERIVTRLKNIFIGRSLGKLKIWKDLYK